MIISANERREAREHIAKMGLEVALSLLCDHKPDEAKEVIERTLLAVNFLDQTDDVPDWIADASDILKARPPQ